MKTKIKSFLLAAVLLGTSDTLFGATLMVDWLQFQESASGTDHLLTGRDDAGMEVVHIRIDRTEGVFVPGSPSSGSLPAESWTSELPYHDSIGNDAAVSSFRTQAGGFGGNVAYTIDVDFLRPTRGVVFGIGQIFASDEGMTGALGVTASGSAMGTVGVPAPTVQIGSDDGINRQTLPLRWSPGDQMLAVDGLDSQARNSGFAFFELEAALVQTLQFEVAEGYDKGSGDILEFSIGLADAVPEPGSTLLIFTSLALALQRRRGGD